MQVKALQDAKYLILFSSKIFGILTIEKWIMVYFLLVSVHLNNISKVLNFFFHNYVDLLKPAQRFFGQTLAKMRKF
jgi:hypothetical protein